jgi:phage shock protein A
MLREVLINAGYLVSVVLAVLYLSDRVKRMISREFSEHVKMFEEQTRMLSDHIRKMETQFSILSKRTSRNHTRIDKLTKDLREKDVI